MMQMFQKAHDKCYEKAGYFDCRCDREIISCLERARIAPSEAQAAAFRSAAITYFQSTICRSGVGWSLGRLGSLFG